MISLITATIGRVDEVKRLLNSLESQTFKDFELIIVDQNNHHLIEDIVNSYQNKIKIKYLRSNQKGLSLNRNIGLDHCQGEIIGFPDDDCYYDCDVLEKVNSILNHSPYKWIMFPVKDIKTGKKYISNKQVDVSRSEILKYSISFNFFIIGNHFKKFDETLGVGAKLGSGEETDFLWNNLDNNNIGYFSLDDIYIYHPFTPLDNIVRAYNYGLGFGAIYYKEIVLRKHYRYILQYLHYLIRCIGAICLKRNKRFYYNNLIGKFKGFFLYR